LTYDNAVIAIEKEVLTWNNLLQNNESLLLKNIGDLRQNSEGNLVFSPANHFNFLTDSFGLSSFVSPVVKREVFKQLEVVQEEEVVAPVYHEDEHEPRRYINPYLKYAAILLMSIGGGAFGYSTYISNVEQTETLMVQAEVQKAVETKIQEATFFIESPIAIETTEVVETPNIIAGAFRSEANANKEFRNLTKKGYQARILNKNKYNLYPVVYGSFVSYIEAQTKMIAIQNSINEDAWILIEEQ
jgi:CCDC81-like prokaryotic HU domain 2/SPOR domain